MLLAVVAALVAAVQLPPSAPGCIAALTVVPSGPVLSGQTLTFTDGTLINPSTHFVSRTWTFGDGTTSTSTEPQPLTVPHTYVNRTGRTEKITVRLVERTGLGTCSTSISFDVGASSI